MQRRCTWTREEDDFISESVNEGILKWSEIGRQLLNVRTGKQCRERWLNYLNPELKRTPWTQEEDDALISAQQRIGNSWTSIAQEIPGRSENEVKNRWYSAPMRKRVKKEIQSTNRGTKRPREEAITTESHEDRDRIAGSPDTGLTGMTNSTTGTDTDTAGTATGAGAGTVGPSTTTCTSATFTSSSTSRSVSMDLDPADAPHPIFETVIGVSSSSAPAATATTDGGDGGGSSGGGGMALLPFAIDDPLFLEGVMAMASSQCSSPNWHLISGNSNSSGNSISSTGINYSLDNIQYCSNAATTRSRSSSSNNSSISVTDALQLLLQTASHPNSPPPPPFTASADNKEEEEEAEDNINVEMRPTA